MAWPTSPLHLLAPAQASVPIPRPEPKPKPEPRTSRSPFATPSSSSSSATNTTSDNLTALFSTSISSSSLADLRGAARSREDAEVAAAKEVEDVEDELVGEDAEGAEAKVSGVGGRIEEEKVAERLDGDGSGGGGGFEIKALLLLLRFLCFSMAVYLL